MRSRAVIGVTAILAMSCFASGLGAAEIVATAAGDHIRNTERTAAITFENGLKEPICAINLWRPSQPPAEAEANWLELTELLQLEPGQRVTVGLQPRDGSYHLRALGCGARGFALSEVVLPQVLPGSVLLLGTPPPAPVTAPLPSSVGL
jgi:hypothetical protein